MDMSRKQLIIYGAGGLAAEALWIAEETKHWNILGSIDDSPDKKATLCYGYPCLGSFDDFVSSEHNNIYFYVAVADASIKRRLVDKMLSLNHLPATLIHPSAVIAKFTTIADGVLVAPQTVIAPGATIGAYSILNTFVGIGHDSQVGRYVNVCPGARVSGHCSIGDGAFIGSNASLLPGIQIGINAIIGANSQIVCNVKEGRTMVGVPAKTLMRNT
jgi:sugar O-acyltransferase (sialic acid O-acetyltransferase NeuD family)